MSEFHLLQTAVSKQFDRLAQHTLFTTTISKDEMWDTYLSSFPQGTNPMFRVRTAHDCACCRQFIKAVGNVVAFVDGELESIWDIPLEGYYGVVAAALADSVKSKGVESVFLHYEKAVGTKHNCEIATGLIWDHFHQVLPQSVIVPKGSIAAHRGQAVTNKGVLQRSLEEINEDALELVLDLIAQNSLYRGEEHKHTVKKLQQLKQGYREAKNAEAFLWQESLDMGGASAFRNTVIGTLLVDLSKGVDLDKAVKSFESKVAPDNYKRPTALITQKMIQNAQGLIHDFGIEDSLPRRYAIMEDLTVNNILFADRTARQVLLGGGLLTDLVKPNAVQNMKDFSKVEEVSIEDFVKNVLPKAASVEVMLESKHEPNLVSLIAPVHIHAAPILKWGNNFSWSYKGEVTDSLMRQHVREKGGNVDGVLRFSIQWNDDDYPHSSDLDAHCVEPTKHLISFRNQGHSQDSSGMLDVDIVNPRGVAVENIIYTDLSRMPDGEYQFLVHYYHQGIGKGFTAEVEFEGTILSFRYDENRHTDDKVQVATVYKAGDTLTLTKSLTPQNTRSKVIWDIATNQFQKVEMVMHSPNHWDGEGMGNKHYFFMLEKCRNPDEARGLYNEFLMTPLQEHRKVFEILGAKLKAPYVDNQLSGVGFSSTKRNAVVVRVTGSFNRVIKVMF